AEVSVLRPRRTESRSSCAFRGQPDALDRHLPRSTSGVVGAIRFRADVSAWMLSDHQPVLPARGVYPVDAATARVSTRSRRAPTPRGRGSFDTHRRPPLPGPATR